MKHITYYHGTNFKDALVPIAQKDTWFVGSGNWTGSGIYFGIKRCVAEHYAPSNENEGIIIVRATMFPTKTSSTLRDEEKSMIGRDGNSLSKIIPKSWCTIEHSRSQSYAGWWEYCILQPGKDSE